VIDALAPLRERTHFPPQSAQEDESHEPASEPLWDETDLFGSPDVPLSMAGMELDEEAGPAPAAVPPVDAMAVIERVEALLGAAPVNVDDLVRACAALVAEVQAALLDLELSGRIERHGGGFVSLRPKRVG
jgi:DNA processing protein